MSKIEGSRRRAWSRAAWSLVAGMALGGLLTKVATLYLADPARTLLTTAVASEFDSLTIDLVVFAFTVGPVSFSINILTVVSITAVALILRAWL